MYLGSGRLCPLPSTFAPCGKTNNDFAGWIFELMKRGKNMFAAAGIFLLAVHGSRDAVMSFS
jgi:hypothetical protein